MRAVPCSHRTYSLWDRGYILDSRASKLRGPGKREGSGNGTLLEAASQKKEGSLSLRELDTGDRVTLTVLLQLLCVLCVRAMALLPAGAE